MSGSDLKWIMGTAQLTDVYGIANCRERGMDEEEALAFLDRAWELGIDGLDTAPGYGDSERMIGRWLERMLQVRPSICTKLSGIGEDVPVEDVHETVRKKLKQSALRLGLAPLDTVLLHSAHNAFSHEGVVWQALVEMKFAGHIQNIGVSVYSPEELEAVAELEDLDVVQIPFSVLDQRLLNGNWAERAAARGIRLIARSVYLQGLLLMSPEEMPLSLQELKPVLQEMRLLAREWGLTMEELALSFTAQAGLFDGIVFGCETMEQLERNLGIVQALRQHPLLVDEQVKQLRERFGSVPAHLVDPRQWRA
jgi:aryl-alcohol dehydrogenase-like predicted oxidoreductase